MEQSPELFIKKPKRSGITRLRNYFLTGFIICAPLAITIYLIWTLIEWVDSWIIPYIPEVYNPDNYLPFEIPGFGLIVAAFIITLVGFLTANFVGRSIVGYGEDLLGRMPLVRNLYSGLKQIFQTVLSDQSGSFQKVGLVEYPRKGLYAIVFVSTDTKGEVATILNGQGVETVSVFLPTTPNPTSGFLLFVPKKDMMELKMGVEDAAKLVISAGLVAPEEAQAQLADLAKEAKPQSSDEPIEAALGNKPARRAPRKTSAKTTRKTKPRTPAE